MEIPQRSGWYKSSDTRAEYSLPENQSHEIPCCRRKEIILANVQPDEILHVATQWNWPMKSVSIRIKEFNYKRICYRNWYGSLEVVLCQKKLSEIWEASSILFGGFPVRLF
ncbi:hypothetical protein SLE2022_315510 [Rubroshorea leprosula]